MKIQQFKDGSANIYFDEHEIEVIKKRKRLRLTKEGLKQFGNILVRIVSEWHLNFGKLSKKD